MCVINYKYLFAGNEAMIMRACHLYFYHTVCVCSYVYVSVDIFVQVSVYACLYVSVRVCKWCAGISMHVFV